MAHRKNSCVPVVAVEQEWVPETIEEVALLLAASQLESLERAAQRRGLCMAQLLRHLIGEFLRRETDSAMHL
jgi:hypothetical protein